MTNNRTTLFISGAAPLTGQYANPTQAIGTVVSMPIALAENTRRESIIKLNQLLAYTENSARPAPRLTAEDIRIHAWLVERLAVVNYERHGLWPKLRRFLLGNRLLRCLMHCRLAALWTKPSAATLFKSNRFRRLQGIRRLG